MCLVLSCYSIGFAQTKGMFSRDPLINLENFQKQKVYFGYYLGFNSFDFKIDYKTVGPDIQVKKINGFNVGIVGDLKLHGILIYVLSLVCTIQKRFKLSHFNSL
jgi:hypothetical protein